MKTHEEINKTLDKLFDRLDHVERDSEAFNIISHAIAHIFRKLNLSTLS